MHDVPTLPMQNRSFNVPRGPTGYRIEDVLGPIGGILDAVLEVFCLFCSTSFKIILNSPSLSSSVERVLYPPVHK